MKKIRKTRRISPDKETPLVTSSISKRLIGASFKLSAALVCGISALEAVFSPTGIAAVYNALPITLAFYGIGATLQAWGTQTVRPSGLSTPTGFWRRCGYFANPRHIL